MYYEYPNILLRMFIFVIFDNNLNSLYIRTLFFVYTCIINVTLTTAVGILARVYATFAVQPVKYYTFQEETLTISLCFSISFFKIPNKTRIIVSNTMSVL